MRSDTSAEANRAAARARMARLRATDPEYRLRERAANRARIKLAQRYGAEFERLRREELAKLRREGRMEL